MHIPSHMLSTNTAAVSAVGAAAGTIGAAFFAAKSKFKPQAMRFAAVTALIFAAQMINFPVQGGTSGHLIGAVLAVSLLGLPFGILSMTMVLAVQSIVFADGGLAMLGANVLNMSIVAALPAAFVHKFFIKERSSISLKETAALFAASWFSVFLASAVCSLQLAVSGTAELTSVLPAMLGVHALIGLGEAIITSAAVYLLSAKFSTSSSRQSVLAPLIAAFVTGAILSPFASSMPDGLEWAAQKYATYKEAAPAFVTSLADYGVSFISNEFIGTAIAGIAGVALTFALSVGMMKLFPKRSES